MKIKLKDDPSSMDTLKLQETKYLCEQMLPKQRKFAVSKRLLLLRMLQQDYRQYFMIFALLSISMSACIALHLDYDTILVLYTFLSGIFLCYELFKAFIYHVNEMQSCLYINLNKLFLYKASLLIMLSTASILLLGVLIALVYDINFSHIFLQSLGAFLLSVSGVLIVSSHLQNSTACFGVYSIIFVVFQVFVIMYMQEMEAYTMYVIIVASILCRYVIYHFI